MSSADELLNSLNDSIMLTTVDPESEPHIVIDDDRKITVPDALRRIAVQYDHNIETVTFDCPRYWDGHDMSTMAIYIKYMRSDGEMGSFLAEHVRVDEADPNIMHFDWTISKNVTMCEGSVSFVVHAVGIDSEGNQIHHWSSELSNMILVSKGLETGDVIEEKYPDVISQLLEMVGMTVDEVLSTTSKNPVQNKVITLRLEAQGNQITSIQKEVKDVSETITDNEIDDMFI